VVPLSHTFAFCILLALACYLESHLISNHHGRYLFGDRDDDMDPDHANSRYCNALRKCWAKPKCVALLAKIKGSLGSHRHRKFPVTWCVENRCMDPEVGVRGRWKGDKKGRVVNRYISAEQLTTDSKLAGVLAVGGPIWYKLWDDIHLSLQLLKSTAAPKMHEHFGAYPSNCVVTVPVLPLLWACHAICALLQLSKS
jgi:hypothetical protein